MFSQQVSVFKEYKFRRHYGTHHADIYTNLQWQMRREKVNKLLANQKRQQSALTQSWDVSQAAIKAIYPVARALASKQFSEGKHVYWRLPTFAWREALQQIRFHTFLQIWTCNWSTKSSQLLHFRLQSMRTLTLRMLINGHIHPWCRRDIEHQGDGSYDGHYKSKWHFYLSS